MDYKKVAGEKAIEYVVRVETLSNSDRRKPPLKQGL